MMNAYDFLSQKYLGNTLENYIWFACILIFGIILKRFLSGQTLRLVFFVIKRYGKIVGQKKFLDISVKPIEFLMTIVIIYLAFNRFTFPDKLNMAPVDQFGFRLILSALFKMAIIISSFWILLRTVDLIALVYIAQSQKTKSLEDDQLTLFMKEAIKVVVVLIGFFVFLSMIFKMDIVSLIAGLGIGGLAIALAAKESLENLIGSFTIFLDKPFVTGDTVKVGNIEGMVENVGFRSTRIRALDKMIVTVPNKKMIDAELINETDRLVRRANFTFTLSFDTTEEKVRKILDDIRLFLNDHPVIENGTESVRFGNLSGAGMEILIVFIVLSPELKELLAIQKEVNFQIMSIVKKNNSNFAAPALFKAESTTNKSTTGNYKTLVSGM